MKRLFGTIVIVLVIVGFAACSSPAEVALPSAESPSAQSVMRTFTVSALPSPAVADAAIPTVSPSPTETAADIPLVSLTPSPSLFVPDTDIPDILGSTDEAVVNSNYTLYEDEKYFYYLDYNYLNYSDGWISILYLVDKRTKSITRITDKDCSCFTVNNGIVYYTEASEPVESFYGSFESFFNVIKSYDPSSNKKKTVKKLDYSICSMAAYNNNLYFSYVSKNAIEPYSDLYVMNLNGKEMEIVAKNVYAFCIYKDVIYYTGCDYPDGARLSKCDINGGNIKEVKDWIDGYFDIGDNRLFYESGYIDLGSGESKDMLLNSGIAPFGHYLIYSDNIWYENKDTCYFYSYDFESAKTTDLTLIGDIDDHSYYDLHPTNKNVYFIVASDDGSFDLYRLVIENGKAGMSLVVSYTTPPSENSSPTNTAGPEPTPALTPTAMPEPYPSVY